MRSAPNPLYCLLNKHYPESFAAFSPAKNDFYHVIHARLPEGWSIERRDMWFYCRPPEENVPLQGWKIHVSATLGNCREILLKAASVLFKYDVPFKFVVDRSLLSMLNGKTWPRGSSGKYITIYPSCTTRFLELIEEIDQATSGMSGPYILSDHRYKASQVVFYRYGGMCTQSSLNLQGERVPVLTAPDGTITPDQRLAYPVLPSWLTPVLPIEDPHGEEQERALLHGRYAVESAAAFSNAGGVYFARDCRTGKRVVVKEARPHINAIADDYDAIALLKKEYRLLTVLADTGIAPRPLDLFQDWEHWFLVEEFIEGTAMSRHSAANNILLRTRVTRKEREDWCSMFGRLCADLMRILHTLHSHDIVFADLSTNNLIVTGDGQGLRIIDFEGAFQPGIDRPTNIHTPGFVSRGRADGGQASHEDDLYSAGAVLLAYLLPINGLLHLNPQAGREFLASIRKDIALPESIVDLIHRLLDSSKPLLSPASVPDDLPQPFVVTVREAASKPAYAYQDVLDDMVQHLEASAEYGRNDRLYPADPRVFTTNPLSLAYGASGVAYTLYKLTGKVPQKAVEWILRHPITSNHYTPGLYVGMSGIAWSLLEMGLQEPAEKIFQSTWRHPLAGKTADLFHGTAGWGMVALKFFHATGKEVYLDQATQSGLRLLASGIQSVRGHSWPASGACPLGLAHGSSGIGLFLLYLSLATGQECYLDAGQRALDFDLAAGVPTKDGGISWSESAETPSPLYPYWRFGSAGVGTAVARFHRVTGQLRYQAVLERIFIETDRKYAVLPGRFTGLAGLGGFLLDMHELAGEQRFLDSATKVAEGIMHFRVEHNGTAFPGELLSRLCCDYGTGSAGIALFLNRLAGRQKNDFMLDEFLQEPLKTRPSAEASWQSECAACQGV